ncbi:glycosyl transferase [Dokdonia pacifica]|uniref:Glycosyltransferase involved in cell wall bisynthesis n=1 Tax=Dokdonia pacifica TaxID=1627892 RepID=A0A238YMU4_9FLAO|nr:glycosyltransferase [Dokdonia pacifica]GGG11430.1 glycosyl transferase [Dokdonia pacifica]SNR71954.1 Glycosyltransferase involved in cell wall bisynthesis [Dokdonia pacifica]
MKNILINLIPIKKGGGQQVATNFVTHVQKINSINCTYLVTKGTEIHKLLENSENVNFVIVDPKPTSRLVFNLFDLKKIIKKHDIDIIYTLFGPSLKGHGVKTVTGCAYSNLFFPEIDFWSAYSKLKQVKLKLIDYYRLKSTLRSDAIVFENAAMQSRAISLFKVPENRTKLILPSISEYLDTPISEELETRLKRINTDHFNILFLTGWHKNKNLQMIPLFLEELKKLGCNTVNCVISVAESHPESQALLSDAKTRQVDNHISFIGSVRPHELPHLYNKIDGVGLLSLLESFSNNIIESWFFKKPLFISDAEWSRAICKDAAIYVNRDNAQDIAKQIDTYIKNKEKQDLYIKNAKKILLDYPSPEEKVNLQIEFLQQLLNE